MADGVYLDLDGAWPPGFLDLQTVDARHWGPRLRYHATRAGIETFYNEVVRALPPFVLYGSGDFHHLSAVLLRRWAAQICPSSSTLRSQRGDANQSRSPEASLTLVSFDNHPDWDIRPPRWACGGWLNRALDLPAIRTASIWGCGNFELAFPSSVFRNRAALRSGSMEVHAWAERQTPATAARYNCMTRDTWRERFAGFTEGLGEQSLYVTVDLDCLRDEEIVTNWENGLFTADDVAWAIRQLRNNARVIAGDICGTRSIPTYARRFQRLAGWWDHPKLPEASADEVRRRNSPAVQTIWRALAE